MKKRKTKNIETGIITLIILAALILIPLGIGRQSREKGYTVMSAQAERGEILLTRSAGGTVQAEDPVQVKLPQGVKITKLLVSEGDYVEQEQIIAEVDPVTAATATEQIRSSMKTVKSKIGALGNSMETEIIYAPSDGRVKAVYAEKNSSAANIVLANKSLIAVSLDGKMTITVKTDEKVKACDSVSVICEDGKKYDGTVRSIRDGEFTASISDEGPRLGAAASVYDESGLLLGKGILEISMPWYAVATEGTVSAIHVKEEQKVSRGTRLLSLKDIENTELSVLMQHHSDYAEMLQDLLQMETTGCLRAPTAGYVSEIDKSLISEDALYSGYNTSFSENNLSEFPIEQNTLLQIIPGKTLIANISVDEQDILEYKPGMQADVTISALDDHVVKGIVTKIAAQGEAEQGRGKFSVKIELAANDNILPGMTASVSIRQETVQNVLLIPVAAIINKGSRSYVYTAYDEKTDTYGDMVEILTGRTNGKSVEVISGLDAGMTVWYSVYGIN